MYFGHALEVLLHEALEDQKDTPAGAAILQKVIQFIEQNPHYLDVVMSVARKTEADSWSFFFAFAGNPQELFEVFSWEEVGVSNWLELVVVLVFR